jgi:hypothetical protein
MPRQGGKLNPKLIKGRKEGNHRWLPSLTVPPRGVEQLMNSPANTSISDQVGTDSGTLHEDPEILAMLAVWPTLSPAKRRVIMGIVRGR